MGAYVTAQLEVLISGPDVALGGFGNHMSLEGCKVACPIAL